MTSTHRPITSKARGVCKYYTTDRGCFNAKSCKFLHSAEPATDPSSSRAPTLTPYDKAKRCKYYDEGYCKRGHKCWFTHEQGVAAAEVNDDDDELCSVCFEQPSVYGLLGGCNHIFCIDCIRKWRDPTGKGGEISNIKKCPMCRAKCRYIIPSSGFFKDGPEKERIVQKYKDSMARVPCKHFVATKAKNPKKPMCPFGKDCFYQHLNDDGTPYIFPHGADISLQHWAQRRGHRHHSFGFLPAGLEPIFFLTEENLAGSIAMDMFDRMMTEVIESSFEGRGGEGAARGAPGGEGRWDRHGGEGIDSEIIERARRDMVTGAVNAIRRQIVAAGTGAPSVPQGQQGDDTRPVIIAGMMEPTNWDLEGDGDGADNGWGWNEFNANPGHNPDVDLTERLELLADNMLGSLRIFRGRDTESPPPPLEPLNLGRSDTPPSPLEPIGDQRDDMPALQSVSNSSDSDEDEDSHDEPDRYSDYDSPDDLPPLQRAFDLAYRREVNPQLEPTQTQPPETRLRFSTVVERHEGTTGSIPEAEGELPVQENVTASLDPPVAALPEDREASTVLTLEAPVLADAEPSAVPLEAAPEPPFVTDGRGRVVWSNKDSTETGTSAEPPTEVRDDVRAAPSSASRLLEWMTGFF
ncbi:hypothetical protein C0991_005432 [Blastosporella zonata]|nr:hypothetical protein C0991_005432 [Blastosporella zonata]